MHEISNLFRELLTQMMMPYLAFRGLFVVKFQLERVDIASSSFMAAVSSTKVVFLE